MKWLEVANAFAGMDLPDIPEIAHYFTKVGNPELITDDAAWGTAVVGLCLTKSGIRPPRSLSAKSYLAMGTPLLKARPGAIVIFGENEHTTRVAFVHSVSNDQIIGIGGQNAGIIGLDIIPKTQVRALRWPAAASGAGDWFSRPLEVVHTPTETHVSTEASQVDVSDAFPFAQPQTDKQVEKTNPATAVLDRPDPELSEDRLAAALNGGDGQEGAREAPTNLALAVALANAAITNGVPAGDYRWHGGETDFEIDGVKMDHQTLIEYAQGQL